MSNSPEFNPQLNKAIGYAIRFYEDTESEFVNCIDIGLREFALSIESLSDDEMNYVRVQVLEGIENYIPDEEESEDDTQDDDTEDEED